MHKPPGTVWYKGTIASHPVGKGSSGLSDVSTSITGRNQLAALHEAVGQDPWTVYEARADVNYGRHVTLARHRRHKMEIVHIQHLSMDLPAARAFAKSVDQLSHPSFPRLLEYYHYRDSCFLVWEPAELSLKEILVSDWRIERIELAQIVQPILQGIAFLRDRGRALAALSPERILLTEMGEVKIVGVESSCELEPPDMNAATVKLAALAAIVNDLIEQNGANPPWGSEAISLSRRLTEQPLDDLLEDAFFKETGEGGLKLLVGAVNRTTHHNIKLVHPAQKRIIESN